MIRKVLIKSFGVFKNFQWPSNLPEFKQFNLIYGWNYSGKTTLSRAFRCFEQQKPHVDFAAAQVQLKSQDGTIHDLGLPASAPVFRVFNTDFIHENLGFDSGSATPILVLGAEDIAKQESLKAKKAERDALVSSKRSNESQRAAKTSAVQKTLTNHARDLIKNPLAVPNYERPNFQARVTKCKANPEAYVLDDETLAQYLAVYRSTDKKPALSRKSPSLSSVARIEEKTTTLLARVVTASDPISRLKENSTIETWVKEGRSLHEGKDTCQFCGQPLPPTLLSQLTGHFSADYEDLMAELSTLAKEIETAQKEDISLDHHANFYSEVSEQFTGEKRILDELLRARNSALRILATALSEKQTKAFTSLECPVVDDPAAQISVAIEAINKTIDEHNLRTAEFDKKRQEAFAKLERHYAASFVRDEKYNEHLQQMSDLKNTIVGQAARLAELDTEIRALEKEISDASKGAERINELLLAYFGKDDLQVRVSADKRFQIVRGGVVAKNLSEGEKTAIAFAHFITRVQDGRHPLEDTRVIIDDPISSLDANHLFNTYALIKTQLTGCRQLFISTHSFEFFNLIREWVSGDENIKKPQSEWRKWGVFILRRTDDGKAVLEEIPKELLRFRSEYHYLFSTLYHFDKAATESFDALLSLPNVGRRFMEAFGGIMIPRSIGLKGKMPKLFPDEIERERVWKFINQYSHNTTITRSLTIPDTSECKAVVQACLKAVRDWDVDYFADLEAEVS